MKPLSIQVAAGGGAALLCAALFGWWFGHDPARGLAERLPGRDRRAAVAAPEEARVRIGELFARLAEDAPPAPLPAGNWPRFRGPNGDNISPEALPLAERWPAGGPPVLWSVTLGEGHAAPVVWGGRVYLLDYDETEKADLLRCFALADGRELWRRGYRLHLKRNHGLSRTVPAVDGRVVLSLGPRCHVMCVAADTGDLLWGLDLERDWGTTVPLWYAGQCPLLDDGIAVLAPAGRVLLAGIDAATGETRWETPNPRGWRMSHSSVVPAVIAGRRMYLYAAVGGVVGVAADGPERGRVLWENDAWNKTVIAPSPVVLPDGRVFLTAGYGAGSLMLQVTEESGTFQARELWSHPPAGGLASEQQTPILLDGHLLAVLPKDAGELRGQFVCARPDAPAAFAWTSGKSNRFGLGPFLAADGKIFLLRDDGLLTLLRASTRAYETLAEARVLADGHDAWGPLALAGGRLLLRDSTRLLCLDVRADADAASVDGPAVALQPSVP
jgi:outer membrane protein assembly factor BamB